MTVRERFPSDDREQFQLRFPVGMRDEIRDAAEANGRSMNAEIIHRLKQVGSAGAATPPSHGPSLSPEIEMNNAEATRKPPAGATGEHWFEVASAYELALYDVEILSGAALTMLISEAEATPADVGGAFIVPFRTFERATAMLRAMKRLSRDAETAR